MLFPLHADFEPTLPRWLSAGLLFEILDYKEQFLFIKKRNDYEITHALSKMLSEIKQTRGSL